MRSGTMTIRKVTGAYGQQFRGGPGAITGMGDEMAIKTIGDYGYAASLHEIADNERAIAEGRIVVVPCPDCGDETTTAELAAGVHLCWSLIGEMETA